MDIKKIIGFVITNVCSLQSTIISFILYPRLNQALIVKFNFLRKSNMKTVRC